jgi:hypothetical protein
MNAMNRDPLVDLGVIYALEPGVNLTTEGVMAVRNTMERFIHGMLSYRDATSILIPALGTAQAIDRIDRILRTPPTPIPSISMPIQSLEFAQRAKTRPWSSYEDQRLLAAIHRLGTRDWLGIAAFVGNNRTKSQCYQRWTRGLDPNINKTRWTPEQDSHLLMLVSLYGNKAWSRVSSEIGNRCDVQCRYRYKQLARERSFPEMEARAQEAAKDFAPMHDPLTVRRMPKQTIEPAYAFQPPVQYIPVYCAPLVPWVPPWPRHVYPPIPLPPLPGPQIPQSMSDATLLPLPSSIEPLREA